MGRQTVIMLRILLCFDIFFLVSMVVLPWLIVFMGIKILLILSFISDVIYNPFSVSQIFLLLLMLLVMSAWRHMQVVFIVMGLPRPAPATDGEAGGQEVAKQ